MTEIYDYLRILVARLGQPYCPACDVPIGTQSADEVIGKIMDHAGRHEAVPHGPAVEIQVGERYETLWEEIRAPGLRPRPRRRPDLFRSTTRRRSTGGASTRGGGGRSRDDVRADARSRIAGSVENALALGKGVLRVAYPQDDVPEPDWPIETHSQHFACDRCGRSFEPLSPHHFSFNSPLGWCPACEGLGVQTGTNPAALLRDPKLTLAQGRRGPVARRPAAGYSRPMLEGFGRGAGRARSTSRSSSSAAGIAAWSCTAPASNGSTCSPSPARQGRGAPEGEGATRSDACFPLPVQGALSGLGRGQPRVARLPQQAGAPGRRSGMHGLRRQPAARRRGGRAAPRPHDRRAMPPAAGQAAWPSSRAWKPDAEPSGRSPARWSARSATGCNSWSTWGWST